MKVDSFSVLNGLNIDMDNNLFKEGDILQGKFLKVSGNEVFLQIEGIGLLKANMQSDEGVKYNDDRITKFLVKKLLSDRIELELLPNDPKNNLEAKPIHDTSTHLKNLLGELEIRLDSISQGLLETLIKYNVKINRDNVIKAIGIYDKLDELISIQRDKIVILADMSKENFDIQKIDIKNFLIEDFIENNILSKELDMGKQNNLTGLIKQYVLDNNLSQQSRLDLLKLTGFLIKFNMEPTLNNIKNILELTENPQLFSEDFKLLEKIFGKKFTNFTKKVNINKENYYLDIGNNNKVLKQTINMVDKNVIEDLLKENTFLGDKKLKQDFVDLKNRMEFINEINKELFFSYLPLNLNSKEFEGLLALFKNKKERHSFKEKINIFINLQTRKLGNIKIFCHVIDTLINIKFTNVAKEDYTLFYERENYLRDFVESTGYYVGDIEYLLSGDYNILDSLIVNKGSTYFLDVEV